MPARRFLVSPQGGGLQLIGATLLPATVGILFGQSISGQTRGIAPFVFSFISSSGTNTWNVSPAGSIFGTPTNAEADNVTVQVQDQFGNVAQAVFTIVVSLQAATPAFNPGAGTYSSAQSVTISDSTPGATIYYTTDGSTPTTASAVYSTPINVAASETVNAMATAPGYAQSNVGSATYTISSASLPAPQQLIFPNAHMMSSYNGEYGSDATYNGAGPGYGGTYYAAELNLLNAYHTGFKGYVMVTVSRRLENYAATQNLAAVAAASGGAAGATGAALQSAINTQYPGFVSIIQKAFYLQQCLNPGDWFGLIINATYLSPNNITNAVITQDWTQTSAPPVVPKDLMNCGGGITVPNNYGSTVMTHYNVDPLYNGSNGYGFFCANLGSSTAFNELLPNWANPGVTQRQRTQLWQALALFQLTGGPAYIGGTNNAIGDPVTYNGQNYLCIQATTGTQLPTNTSYWKPNPFAGQTLAQTQLLVYMTHNDEYSWVWDASQNISGGTVVNPPYHGVSGITPNDSTFFSQWQVFFNKRTAAFPNIFQGDCFSWGVTGATPSIMAGHINNEISGNGLSAIRGYAQSSSDVVANLFNLNGWTYPQADYVVAGMIGIVNPPSPWPVSGQINHVAQYDIAGGSAGNPQKLMVVGNVQVGDYLQQETGTQPAPNTEAIVAGIQQSATYYGCELMLWCSTSVNPSTEAQLPINPTDPTSPWPSWIQPGVIAAQASTPLLTTLPLLAMYGPAITSGVVNSTTSVTINWAPIPTTPGAVGYQGSGLNYLILRNNTNISGSGVSASAGTYTDTTVVAGTAYTYTLAMSNANGTGPAGAGLLINTPVFSFSSFTPAQLTSLFNHTSSCAVNGSNAGGIANSLDLFGTQSTQHSAGGAYYNQQQNISSFTSHFTIALATPASIPAITGMCFVVQNLPGGAGAQLAADANCCGYGAYGPPSNPPGTQLGDSIAIKFDINNANTIQTNWNPNVAGAGPSTTGLYVNGGMFSGLYGYQDLNPYGINLNQGHTYACTVVYDGTLLTLVMRDTTSGTQFRTSWPVNIPAVTGGNNAWVGFVAGTLPITHAQICAWDFNLGYNTRLATPTFSVAQGQYTSAQTVALSGPAGASIYYSTNGQQPTSASALYSVPITVSASTIVQAVAIQTGYTDSLVAVANYQIQANGLPLINFPSGFAGAIAPNLLTLPGYLSKYTGSQIQMTDNTAAGPPGGFEISGAWYNVPVPYATFTTVFTLQSTGGTGNGWTFCIQQYSPTPNNGATQSWILGGPAVLGDAWTGLGYSSAPGQFDSGIPHGSALTSVAVKFDVRNGLVGIITDSADPTLGGTSTAPVSLGSGNPITVTLVYNGTVLALTLHDAIAGTTYTQNFTINIPATVDPNNVYGGKAYVGFTSSTGYSPQANQFVNNWTYATP